MKKVIKLLSILCIILFTVSTAYSAELAQNEEKKEQPVKHLTLEDILVTDEAIKEPDVVGVKTIERGKNTTIPDVLKYEPDIDISRRSLVGDTRDTLKIRGLSGNRIMLTIDGRSVNAAGVQGGYFIDWSTIPLDNIEKIEVMKGGSSVKYGNNAGGGVINVITRRPTEKATYSFYGNYGSGDDISSIQNYRINHTYKIGFLGYSLSGSYQKADAFLWNNDYEAKNGATTLYADMPLEAEMSLGIQYTNVDRGFTILNRLSEDPDDPDFYEKRNPDYPLSLGEGFSPNRGNVTTPGPGAFWEKTKYILDFAYRQPIKTALLEFKAYKNHENRDEKNYSDDEINNAYSDGELVLDRTVKSDRSYGRSLELTMPLKNHEILAGIERKVISTGGQDVRFVDENYGTRGPKIETNGGGSSYIWAYYLQDSWGITDTLLLTPGIRYDTYEVTETGLGDDATLDDKGLSLSLTGTYSLAQDDIITASIYRKYLSPSAPDSWWWYEGYSSGLYDTLLKMERNDALELAYKHDFSKKAFTRLSLYHYNIRDYINRYSLPTRDRGCYNIDKVQLRGASVDGAAEIMDGFTLRGNISHQKSKKEGDINDTTNLRNELAYIPEIKGTIGVDIKLPFKETLFSAHLRYVGKQETVDGDKVIELDSYTTTNIELKIPVTEQGEISLYAENLFDKEYEERFGYPMPGRIIGASVKVGF